MIYWTEYDFNNSSSKLYKKKKKLYNDEIFTFDIETSSVFNINGQAKKFDYRLSPKYYRDIDKYGFMYIWQFGINDTVMYGRTFDELKQFFSILNKKVFGTKIVYIHNLSFEFEFLLNIIDDFELFARKPRHPLKGYTATYDIEFRCSYFLTNMSLDKTAKAMKIKIDKKVGALDYEKVRTHETKLTDIELEYCEYDCLVLYEIIKVYLEQYNHVENIPLTQTGRVRREIKKIYKNNTSYYKRLKSMLPTTFLEFKLLCDSFSGGYTHSNPCHTNVIRENVKSMDIASSYPTVMLSEKFPMSKFIKIKMDDLNKMDTNKYAYIIKIRFFNLKTKCDFTYLSKSKAIICKSVFEDNGRIVLADEAEYILTDPDIDIIRKCYIFDYIIDEVYISLKGYLDINYVEYILKLYEYKTTYKGVEEYEDLYKRSKEFINSLYGMCVTNVIRDDLVFLNNSWVTIPINEEDAERKLNKLADRRKTFVNFAWGVWITAYARKNLWNVILQIYYDVIYVDTDSIKYINNHDEIFKIYNAEIIKKLEIAMKNFNLDFNLTCPKDSLGIPHQIGIFELDAEYEKFKTLGAKKYAYENNGELNITISGVNKNSGSKFMSGIEEFKTGFIFDYKNSGRKIISYNDNQPPLYVKDYKGKEALINQKYGINLMPTTYTLDIIPNYDDFITKKGAETSTKLSLLEGETDETEIL